MVKARKVDVSGSGKGFSPSMPKKEVTGRSVRYRGRYSEDNLKLAM
jgi:hypothetical protein